MKSLKPHTVKNLARLLIVAGLGLGVLSVVAYMNQPIAPAVPPSVRRVADTDPAPSSVKPDTKAVASYSVAPDAPKYISISAAGIRQTRVVELGVQKNGAIATPNNIYDTGWYRGSAKPGQDGAMFIYGHVSNWTANGVFYNLKKLKSGDKVTVVRGDDKQFTYQVVSTKAYPHDAVDMHAVLSPAGSGKAGLNLMTCTGPIIKGTSEFSQRLVVFTSLVGDN